MTAMASLSNRSGFRSEAEVFDELFESAPLGFDAGDTNLSRYVGNVPTMLTDPTGLIVAGNDAYIPDGTGDLGYSQVGQWIPFQYSIGMVFYPDMGEYELIGEAWLRQNADGSIDVRGDLFVKDATGCTWMATPSSAELALWNWNRTRNPDYLNDPVLKDNAEYLAWIRRSLADPRWGSRAGGGLVSPIIANNPRNPARLPGGGRPSGGRSPGSSTLRPPGYIGDPLIIPGLGSQAVTPPLIRRPIAGKWPAIMKDGKVYVHYQHMAAQEVAGCGANVDQYGFVTLDSNGNVIDAHWVPLR